MQKVALVTGGTRGIGAAISERLAEEGYRVVANYAQNYEAAAAFSARTGIRTIAWDVGDYDACILGVAQVVAQEGPISVLVNNAGIVCDAPFHKMTPSQWHKVLHTNLDGLFNMTQQVWSSMRSAGFGRVINISSINGQRGQFGQVNYASAKAGELGFTKALALEGARYGITVNAIAPGYISTEMTETLPPAWLQEKVLPQIPVGRFGKAEDIARSVVFLASDEASFITGATLPVNGGHYIS